tara:strand:+ start:485 stop:922 length:438 start_codon:yes stop_codon:yes gene_type:complete
MQSNVLFISHVDLVLYNLIINSVLVGVILITQIVNYPLFKYVKTDFTGFHKKYVKKIGFVVAPIMIIEVIIISGIILRDFNNNLIQLITILLLIIWTSTFFIQVPIHRQLSLGVKKKLNLLVYSNWVRTICWILKLIISIMLFKL